MNNTARKIADFSIWDSVVNDRIIQFEDLDRKYREKCRQTEALTDENEKLKEKMEEALGKIDSVYGELNAKDAQIQALVREAADLRQWIADMENSSSWKVTKPIRMLVDKVRGKREQ